MSLLLVVLSIGTLVYLAYIVEFLWSRRPGRVIYYGSNLREQGPLLLKIIKKYIPDTREYCLIEPGAGLGKVAEYLARHLEWADVAAVELGPVILTFGRIRAFIRRAPITFVHQNIFDFETPCPSVVYCYLTSDLLNRLYKNGQLNGSLVISLTFPLTGVRPTETIELKSWQARLLVYDFRKK